MISFGRSGGTVLNQCLGCLPNVIMLSEVNPLGGGSGKDEVSYSTVKSQAMNWYGINLKSDNFTENLLELEEICTNSHKHLVVRDWSFINFYPTAQNHWKPINTFLTLEALEDKVDLISFTFVRDSIDVWISFGMPDCTTFFESYLKYVNKIVDRKIPIFKYEDFCKNPEKIVQEICKISSLEYNHFQDKYYTFDKVNGDIQIISRGRTQNSIRPLLRKIIKKEKISEINQCDLMIEANNLLNYPTSYHSVPRENLWIKGAQKILNSLRIKQLKLN